ncbi:MAG: Hsp20/alpha crystallin family protein [Lachnospiraceae bacterium]|nr:Hsp20/alpha crystallin family protein [Lachnospiraceae bacterium]MEE0920259.1 Hsp20/alpha crystallin family protein [Lachnospiraceae bacterium]
MLMPRLFNDNFDLIDRFYEDPWFGFNDQEFKDLEKKLYGHRAKNIMNTDIKESDTAYVMEIDLPGFTKDEVSAQLNNGYLIISAVKQLDKNEADSEENAKKGNYIRRERYSGSCQRSFYVGENVKEEDISAKFEQGILTLTVPKKDEKHIEKKGYISIEG